MAVPCSGLSGSSLMISSRDGCSWRTRRRDGTHRVKGGGPQSLHHLREPKLLILSCHLQATPGVDTEDNAKVTPGVNRQGEIPKVQAQ